MEKHNLPSGINNDNEDSKIVNQLNPLFEDLYDPETLIEHVENLVKKDTPILHAEILNKLLEEFEPVDFQALAFPKVEGLRKQLESISPGSEQAKEILKNYVNTNKRKPPSQI